MRNPINLQIQHADPYWSMVEVTPLLIEQEKDLVSRGIYEFMRVTRNVTAICMTRRRWGTNIWYIELSGGDHPGFLGATLFRARLL